MNPLYPLFLATLLLALACHPSPPEVASSPPSETPPTGQDPEPTLSVVEEAAPPPAPTPQETPLVLPNTLEEIHLWIRAGKREGAIKALQKMEPSAPPHQRTDIHYLLGKTLVEDQKPEGLQWLQKLPVPYEFEELRLFWIARGTLLQTHAPQESLKAIQNFLSLAPKSPEAPAMRLAKIKNLYALGKTAEADKALSGIPTKFRALVAEALFLQARHSPDRASRARKTLLIRYPETSWAKHESITQDLKKLSDQERIRRARTLLKRWDYQEARKIYRTFLEDPRHRDEAAWEVAVISLRKLRDDPAEARKLLQRVIRKSPQRREKAYYLLMRSYMKQERYEEALQVADRYSKEFPGGEYTERMDYYRGWLPYDRRKCKEARPHFNHYLKKHKAKRSVVMGFRAWCSIRDKDWETAVRDFGAMLPLGNPLVRGKARYWRAYALKQLGREEEAGKELNDLHRRYPLTYYDLLGQQLLATWEGRDARASALPWPEGGGHTLDAHPLPEDAWSWPSLKGSDRKAYRTVKRLVDLGEVDRARKEWKRIRKRVESRVPASKRWSFMRFMAHKIEDHKHGWKTVTRGRLAAMTSMPDPSDERWLLAYPRAYAPLVERLAEEFELPSHYIYSIMRQESRYNPRAISHTDAVGALQMIPPTARRVAKEMDVVYNPETFPRPDVGFRYSAFYLQKHARLFQGQLLLSAASYNGGPEPIARWVRENQGATLPFLVEEFAYNESRIYCRKVTEHTLRYLYLYEKDPEVRGKWLDALFPLEVNGDLPDDVGY